ncbi:SBBP repeat-containing protein [bacterium]|nr:SBBP repeat-containing protein [bacterium]
MKRKHLALGKGTSIFILIIFIYSIKVWATGTFIVISSATYNGPVNRIDRAFGSAVDTAGNIVVSGCSDDGSNSDYFTIKYNNDLSAVLGSAVYNGPANGHDYAYGVAVDGAGNIIVTGDSHNGTNFDYFTIKYNDDLSVVLGSAAYNNPANANDYARGIDVDGEGNIFITGWSYNGGNFDYVSIKYNNDLSVVLGSATYNGSANGEDCGRAIVIDRAGDIVVTGYSNSGINNDYFTIKYNDDFSVVLGSAAYNSPANLGEYAMGVVADVAGNIFISGRSYNGTNMDYCIVKYNSDLSQTLGAVIYNGPANGEDWARRVVAYDTGNVVVTGKSNNGINDDYFTIKYDSNLSVVLASATYNGPADNDDRAFGIVLDGTGNIIVSGYSFNGSDDDYFTIKYHGPPRVFSVSPSFALPGDTLDVAINGLNFYNGAALTFSGTGILVNSVNFISATDLIANITIDAAAVSGNRNVIITNIDEAYGIIPAGFEIGAGFGYQINDNFCLVEVFPRIFSPNGDGINDLANFIFENPENEEVRGMIFDLSGSVVRDTLVQNSATSLTWDGRDNRGVYVSSNVYVYQIKGGSEVFNGTVVLAK